MIALLPGARRGTWHLKTKCRLLSYTIENSPSRCDATTNYQVPSFAVSLYPNPLSPRSCSFSVKSHANDGRLLSSPLRLQHEHPVDQVLAVPLASAVCRRAALGEGACTSSFPTAWPRHAPPSPSTEHHISPLHLHTCDTVAHIATLRLSASRLFHLLHSHRASLENLKGPDLAVVRRDGQHSADCGSRRRLL